MADAGAAREIRAAGALMAGEIFISYRRADEAWARLLYTRLQAEGVEAWYDAHVGAGQDWRVATAKALQASRIFVLLFSSNAARSDDIAKELAAAVFEKKLIVPVRLENIAPEGAFLYELASRNWINAYENTEAKLNELAHSLAKLVKDGIKDESILPFDRAAGGAPKPAPRKRAGLITAGVVLAVILAAAGSFLMWPRQPAPLPAKAVAVRVAVSPFDVLGDDPALSQFAGGLQAEIAGELSQSQIPVVSPQDVAALKGANESADAARLHVAYAFGGTVERQGKDFLVRAHMDDARQGVTVWSYEFSGNDGDPGLLQKEVAALASQAAGAARSFDKLANGDTDAMTLLIKSNQYSFFNRPQDRQAEWDNMRKLVARFPSTALFHSNFAVISAFLAISSSPARAAELRATASAQAKRALELDPHDAIAFFAQALVFPSIGHWGERESYILRGLKAVPHGGGLLTNIESNLLRETGRLKDAIVYGRQAQAMLPYSANRDATLILAFAAGANSFEGDPLAQTAAKSWPQHPAAWNARLQSAVLNSRWDQGLALLQPGGYVPIPEAAAQAWRGALMALKSGGAAAKRDAVRRLVALSGPDAPWTAPLPNEVMSPGGAIGLLAMLGETDTAFAQADAYLKRDSYADSSFLFWPTLASFRRDPRFMPLAARIGLVAYWRTSGDWPDFCGDADLTYNCKTEADRLDGKNPPAGSPSVHSAR
jgi:TolB-like protein